MNGIIIPTYNEIENIGKLIKLIEQELKHVKHTIYIVDDNSPDGTVAFCKAMKYKPLKVIVRKGTRGYGGAVLAGIKQAIEDGCTKIITMDADLSHNPKYLLPLINSEGPITIGSRYVLGGGVINWGIYRKAVSKCANFFAGKILKLNTLDCTSGYRCYSSYVFKDFPFESINSNSYSFLEEILFRLKERGYITNEVPIIFVDRRYGETKFSVKEIFKFFTMLLRLKFSNKKDEKKGYYYGYNALYGRKVQRFWYRNKYKIISSLFNPDKENVLEVGCESGVILNFIDIKNYFGVDKNPDAITAAKRLHPFASFSLKLPKGKKFDCALMIDVFEHLDNKNYNELVNYAKHIDKIIMVTPNYNTSIWGLIERLWDIISPVKYKEEHIRKVKIADIKMAFPDYEVQAKTFFILSPIFAVFSIRLAEFIVSLEQRITEKYGMSYLIQLKRKK